MAKNTTQAQAPNFEADLQELESIVERMEKGDQTLENSLQDFERGMELSRQCQSNLKQAELRVEKMITKQGQSQTEPFDIEEELSD